MYVSAPVHQHSAAQHQKHTIERTTKAVSFQIFETLLYQEISKLYLSTYKTHNLICLQKKGDNYRLVHSKKKNRPPRCVRTAFAMPASDVGNSFRLRICTPPVGTPNQNLGINKVVSPPRFQPSSPPQRRHQYSPAAH